MDVSALESELRASAVCRLRFFLLTGSSVSQSLLPHSSGRSQFTWIGIPDSPGVQIYDWVITFSHEVDYIWGSRWNIVKVLYLFIRYTSVIDTVLALQGRTEEPQICNDHRATFNTRKYSKLYPRFIR
ncbi:hypothetical protein WG66_010788 [Moniliophthora roreri]|uniref:DUF6533 domain-containing protein n=1 Tax=Moniliophthora roreri TaxID=221103 RepID=A0A0W0G758_MONRR|nr:hypothetical protein WG66_010788 [Moniliophthora roreri]